MRTSSAVADVSRRLERLVDEDPLRTHQDQLDVPRHQGPPGRRHRGLGDEAHLGPERRARGQDRGAQRRRQGADDPDVLDVVALAQHRDRHRGSHRQ